MTDQRTALQFCLDYENCMTDDEREDLYGIMVRVLSKLGASGPVDEPDEVTLRKIAVNYGWPR